MDDKIRIPFTREANGYRYSDCIFLSKDHTFTEAEVQQIQDMRFANWMTHIQSASSAAPTEEIVEQPLPSTGE